MSTPWILEGTFDLSKSADRLKVEDAVKAWEAQKNRCRRASASC